MTNTYIAASFTCEGCQVVTHQASSLLVAECHLEDRTDYRASRMDNSNYKEDSYYHKDVTCDRITAQLSRLTQIGSTRSSNLWLLGSETSRHLHLTEATLIIYTTQQLINSCCDC